MVYWLILEKGFDRSISILRDALWIMLPNSIIVPLEMEHIKYAEGPDSLFIVIVKCWDYSPFREK